MTLIIEEVVQNESISSLEKAKFYVDDDGYLKIRTSSTGTFSSSGLFNGGKITEVTLNSSTWTEIPGTPLLNRNAISIQNESLINIKVNYTNIEPGYVGATVMAGQERNYDIKDTIILYAKSESGTPTVTIEEIS